MAIGHATQIGDTVHVYDEAGRQLYSRKGLLNGFTPWSVVIRNHMTLCVFNEYSQQISCEELAGPGIFSVAPPLPGDPQR